MPLTKATGEGVAAVIHPEVEWHTRAGPVLGVEVVSGRDEVLHFVFEQIPEAIEDFRTVVRDMQAFPGGMVLVTGHYSGRGVTSGAEVEMEATQLYRFDEGNIIFFQDFATCSEALAAAGLRE
jgi:ketosteroid isomerase-like protein